MDPIPSMLFVYPLALVCQDIRSHQRDNWGGSCFLGKGEQVRAISGVKTPICATHDIAWIAERDRLPASTKCQKHTGRAWRTRRPQITGALSMPATT